MSPFPPMEIYSSIMVFIYFMLFGKNKSIVFFKIGRKSIFCYISKSGRCRKKTSQPKQHCLETVEKNKFRIFSDNGKNIRFNRLNKKKLGIFFHLRNTFITIEFSIFVINLSLLWIIKCQNSNRNLKLIKSLQNQLKKIPLKIHLDNNLHIY